jgi:hypothetical protein
MIKIKAKCPTCMVLGIKTRLWNDNGTIVCISGNHPIRIWVHIRNHATPKGTITTKPKAQGEGR